MSELIFQTLAKFGYHHPIHPAMTHLPAGLVMAGVVFGLIAFLLRRDSLAQTARHCVILALIALLPTAILGYMDWQHFYGGSWLFPIKMKVVLAAFLLIFLLIAAYWSKKAPKGLKMLIAYLFCLLTVVGLGYFGGELVYGTKEAPAEIPEGLAKEGAGTFNQKCVFCHFPDRTDHKVGPGLKGLFQRETLHKSRWPVTEANVRKQLTTPFESMPPIGSLPKETLDALLAYLKTL